MRLNSQIISNRFFVVSKGGAMEEFTKELLDQLNVNTAFTIGPFAISESVVITWVVMAILVLLPAWLTHGLKVHNPGKKQIVAESIVLWLDKFTISMLGENAKKSLERAKERMRQKQSIREYYMSQASMARALARLQFKDKHIN